MKIHKELVFGFCLFIISCSNTNSLYHANWSVTKFYVDGIDETSKITLYNLRINLRANLISLPKFDSSSEFDVGDTLLKVSLEKGKDMDVIIISGNSRFAGEYVVQCYFDNCCRIILSNELFRFELDYNGEIEHRKFRDCPEPRFNVLSPDGF